MRLGTFGFGLIMFDLVIGVYFTRYSKVVSPESINEHRLFNFWRNQ